MTAAFGRVPGAVRGAVWMMVSAVGWTTMVAVARGMSETLHTFEIVFFRSLFALIFFLPWLHGAGLKGLHTQRFPMHLVRGAAALTALYLLFGALNFISIGDVAAITFTRPIIASLGAILVLHEVARGRRSSESSPISGPGSAAR